MKRFIKKKYRMLVLTIEVCFLLIALLLAYNAVTFPSKKTIFYLKDSNSSTLLHMLNKKGYKTYDIDKFVLAFMPKLKKGWYQLDEVKLGRLHFFYTLDNKYIRGMNIKIYAGETTQELIKRLANDMKLDPDKLLEFYKHKSRYKEANIFAGQYNLPRNADENMTMAILFDKSNEILETFQTDFSHTKISQEDMKIFLTIASIIQKESNDIHEMPLISSVIYNRLLKGMKLQMDGTLNYGEYSHTIVTPERIRNDYSTYNTYKYKGIPPHPLCTVSIEALHAAYKPAQTDYLFFMLNKDGSHNFAKTYKEHLENVRAFKKKKADDCNTSKSLKLSA